MKTLAMHFHNLKYSFYNLKSNEGKIYPQKTNESKFSLYLHSNID
jgi:hypothetical protein